MPVPANPLFRKFPRLRRSIPWVSLIENPTPVVALSHLGREWNHAEIYAKREDFTSPLYGGNKVRNLEFVLGKMIHQKQHQCVTLVPYGSNFTAALASEAQKLGLRARLIQFVAQENQQIHAHAQFAEKHGAEIITHTGPFAVAKAVWRGQKDRWMPGAGDMNEFWITPGASSVEGALGHTQALLELVEQIESGELPAPDDIVVGAGTCGTISGILAGLKISGLKSRLIGVRGAHPLVCNKIKIRGLANDVLKQLGKHLGLSPQLQVGLADFHLHEAPGHRGYAIPSEDAAAITDEFWATENIPLDSTYTSKVGLYLKQQVLAGFFDGRRVLYWHTYSSKAMLSANTESPKLKPGGLHGNV